MDDIARLGIEVDSTQVKKAEGDLNSLGNTSDKTEKKVKTLSDAFSNNLKSAVSGIGLAGLAYDILKTNMEMESLRAALTSTVGSIEGGKSAFQFVLDFAKDTPYEVKGLTETFVMLKNMGINPTTQVMEALTNQASKLGGSQETLTSIALQLGQAHSKGKLQMEDMIVLMERGVPVMEILADVTGRNAAELADMSSKGQITTEIIDKLILKMGELSQGSNANAMDTLKGRISSLSDAWHNFEDALLNDKSEGILKNIVEDWTYALDGFREYLFTVADPLDEINAKIEKQAKLVAATRNPMAAGNDPAQQKKLEDLYSERDSMMGSEIAKTQAAQKKELDHQALVDHKKVMDMMEESEQWNSDVVIKAEHDKTEARKKAATEHKSSVDSAIKIEKTRLDSINQVIEAIKQETAQVGLSTKDVQRSNELHTALNKAKGDEVRIITESLKVKWQEIDANEKQNKQWAALIEDANAYYDIRKSIDGIIRGGITDTSFNSGIGSLRDSLDAGTINEQQFKEQSARLAQAYNSEFVEPASKATEQLSAFAEQAAKNMESSFADFLFDPFGKGTTGMLDSFLNTIKRMAAEAASANIMEGLFGKQSSGGGFNWGGLIGKGLSIAAGAVAGSFGGMGDTFGNSVAVAPPTAVDTSAMFANGGIMTSGGAVPLNRYASGGVANSPQLAMFGEGRTPEAYVPLPDGRNIPVKMDGKAQQTQQVINNYNVNISTPNADSFRRSERQLKQQLSMATGNV